MTRGETVREERRIPIPKNKIKKLLKITCLKIKIVWI